jgi:hypothetical protein
VRSPVIIPAVARPTRGRPARHAEKEDEVGVYEHLTEFAGRPVRDWDADGGIRDAAGTAYRLSLSYDEADNGATLADKLGAFLADPNAGQVEALVIGSWNAADAGESSEPIVEALAAAARGRLVRLRHLFFGDIISEECEISWIVQSDLSPLLEAYPDLEHLTVRGGQGLSLGAPRHEKLRELVLQSGGLPPAVVHEVTSADLPALEHLELWLGTPSYEGNATVEDVAPLLWGDRFPWLRYLGLKNSEIQDEIAQAVAAAPVLDRLEVLDLSMGTLGDAGAKALLDSRAVRRLRKLDIHHHYVTPSVVARLQALGIEVDASDSEAGYDEEDPDDAEDTDDDRYVAHAE